jgi:hypothetical protein
MRKTVSALSIGAVLATAGWSLSAPADRIGDLVWVDLNRDGAQEPGEPGAAGVLVTAIRSDGVGYGTRTDSAGHYLFDNLPDGTYQVCFAPAGLPAGYADYELTRPHATDGALDSDADLSSGCTPVTTLGDGHREDLGLDAGLVSPPNRIGDLVWLDTNSNGLQDGDEPGLAGVTVALSDGSRTMTGPDGRYVFDDLPDGTFTVCFVLPSGYRFTSVNAGEDSMDSDADPATGCTQPVNLGIGNRDNLTVDAGVVPSGGSASQG